MITWAEAAAKRPRIIAGLMTGTSMDGLDMAICRVAGGDAPAMELLAFDLAAYPEDLHRRLAGADRLSALELSRLHQELGRFFADALAAVVAREGVTLDAIGSHGQTIAHEHRVHSLQIGAAAPLAERFRCPVIYDFRAGDIAAGGCGAPLVPYVDARFLAQPGVGLVALNIGGIANLTALDGGADSLAQAIGFDTGPGNMILDRLAERFTAGSQAETGFDADGRFAAAGSVRRDLLADLMAHPFITSPRPKSAGREQYGHAFTDALIARENPESERAWYDLFATAAAFTVDSIVHGIVGEVVPRMRVDKVVVSGGGARNAYLMAELAKALPALEVSTTDGLGWPVDAKEAMAFAFLASERLDRRPANLPAATGAARPVLLGAVLES